MCSLLYIKEPTIRPLFRNKSKNRICKREGRKEETARAGNLRTMNCGLQVWGKLINRITAKRAA